MQDDDAPYGTADRASDMIEEFLTARASRGSLEFGDLQKVGRRAHVCLDVIRRVDSSDGD